MKEKFCILIQISLKFVPKGLIDNNPALVSIGLDNGLAPIRRQAIIWTNVDPINWCIYEALWGYENKYGQFVTINSTFVDTLGYLSLNFWKRPEYFC